MSGSHLEHAVEVSDPPPQAPPAAESQPAVRYQALDAARGILMMLGIVLHASNIFAPHIRWKIDDPSGNVFFDMVSTGIWIFRMPAFFWISGFFCALTFEHLGAAGLLGRRLPRLAVPLLSAWLFLNVPQELIVAYHESLDPIAHIANGVGLSHLWFLLDLLVYVALAALVLPYLPGKLELPAWLEGSVVMQSVLLAIVTQVVIDAARLTTVAYAEPLGLTSLFRLATYLPFFAAGILMYRMPSLREGFLSVNPWWLVLALPVAMTATEFAPAAAHLIKESAHLVASAATWLCVAAVLSFFHRAFRRDSPFTRKLADASYTVYLFHHLIVILLGMALLKVALGPGVKFTIICAVTLALTLVLHFAVVRRVPLLRWLFNGR